MRTQTVSPNCVDACVLCCVGCVLCLKSCVRKKSQHLKDRKTERFFGFFIFFGEFGFLYFLGSLGLCFCVLGLCFCVENFLCVEICV